MVDCCHYRVVGDYESVRITHDNVTDRTYVSDQILGWNIFTLEQREDICTLQKLFCFSMYSGGVGVINEIQLL